MKAVLIFFQFLLFNTDPTVQKKKKKERIYFGVTTFKAWLLLGFINLYQFMVLFSRGVLLYSIKSQNAVGPVRN